MSETALGVGASSGGIGPAATPRRLMWWKFRAHRLALVSLAVIGLLYLVMIFCGFVAPYDPELKTGDPLAAPHGRAGARVELIEMRVQRLDATRVNDTHHVAPVAADIACLDDDARGDRVDRIAKIRVAAAVAVPVVAEVLVVAERLRVVIADGIGRTDGEVEAVARG